jgi:hypothetical protein
LHFLRHCRNEYRVWVEGGGVAVDLGSFGSDDSDTFSAVLPLAGIVLEQALPGAVWSWSGVVLHLSSL